MWTTEPLIVVIDDDEGIVRSLSRILTSHGYRVRTAMRAADYLEDADGIEPACVLADIRMPDIDGIALAQAMRAAGVDAPIIFMTGTGDVSTVVEAMKLGAVDLLPKPFSAETLVAAVGRAIEEARRTEEAHRALVALWRLAGRLTPREAEVCALVASGSPNKNVAARIGTTEKTVKVHRGRVMHKLAAQSLAELVRLVDRVIAEPDRRTIHLDGVEITRPSSVDILVRVVAQARAAAAARAGSTAPLLIEPLGTAAHRPSVNS